MITLYKFGPIEEVSDPSPFCVKVEAYLRMMEIPYETRCGAEYLRKAPKRKLPFIEDQGKTVADSSFIIDYLKAAYGDKLDADLDPRNKAIAHAFARLIEENLYWVLVHTRWKLDSNWKIVKKNFFGSLAFPVGELVSSIARREVLSALYKQGLGRHSDDEIVQIGFRDLKSLSDFLDDKPFFLGDRPTSVDASVYASLAEIYRVKAFTSPFLDAAGSFDNLIAYTDRFHRRYFSGTS